MKSLLLLLDFTLVQLAMMDDNATPHRAIIVNEYLQQERIEHVDGQQSLQT